MAIAARQLASWAAASELAAVAQITSRAAAADSKIGVAASLRPSRVCRDAVGQVEMALTLTHYGAEEWADLAVTLAWRLPATGQALAAGFIDAYRARLIADGTSVLSEEDARRVEERALHCAGRRTYADLRERLARAVIAVDPEGAERRRQDAERHADVRLYADDDQTATISASKLPQIQAAAGFARLDALARARKAAGLPGSLGFHRSQVLLGMMHDTLPYIPPAEGTPPDQFPPGHDGLEDDSPGTDPGSRPAEDGSPGGAGPADDGGPGGTGPAIDDDPARSDPGPAGPDGRGDPQDGVPRESLPGEGDPGSSGLRDSDLSDEDLGGSDRGDGDLSDEDVGGSDRGDGDLSDGDLSGSDRGDGDLGERVPDDSQPADVGDAGAGGPAATATVALIVARATAAAWMMTRPPTGRGVACLPPGTKTHRPAMASTTWKMALARHGTPTRRMTTRAGPDRLRRGPHWGCSRPRRAAATPAGLPTGGLCQGSWM